MLEYWLLYQAWPTGGRGCIRASQAWFKAGSMQKGKSRGTPYHGNFKKEYNISHLRKHFEYFKGSLIGNQTAKCKHKTMNAWETEMLCIMTCTFYNFRHKWWQKQFFFNCRCIDKYQCECSVLESTLYTVIISQSGPKYIPCNKSTCCHWLPGNSLSLSQSCSQKLPLIRTCCDSLPWRQRICQAIPICPLGQ